MTPIKYQLPFVNGNFLSLDGISSLDLARRMTADAIVRRSPTYAAGVAMGDLVYGLWHGDPECRHDDRAYNSDIWRAFAEVHGSTFREEFSALKKVAGAGFNARLYGWIATAMVELGLAGQRPGDVWKAFDASDPRLDGLKRWLDPKGTDEAGLERAVRRAASLWEMYVLHHMDDEDAQMARARKRYGRPAQSRMLYAHLYDCHLKDRSSTDALTAFRDGADVDTIAWHAVSTIARYL